MNLNSRDPEARHSRLPHPKHVAFAAQPQILLGDAKTVLGLAQDLDTASAVSPSGAR